MQLIQDAGVTGLAIVALFVIGLGLRASGRSTSTLPWAVALLALGQIGQSIGMNAVRDAVTGDTVVEDIGIIVVVGASEASANLLLAGLATLVLLAIGALTDKLRA
jgi:hypothetical protein